MAMDDEERWLTAQTTDRRTRMTYRHRTNADSLRRAWRSGATAQGWTAREWWTPGVDAVTRALAAGRDAAQAHAQLGQERAEAGYGIRTVLADVHTLHHLTASPKPPPQAARALVQAWATVRLAPVRVMVCANFATAEQLRAGLTGLYRRALPAGLAVLAVEVADAGTGWEAVTLLLEASARTPSIFAAQAPIARTSPRQLLALVREEAGTRLHHAGFHAARVIPLPQDLTTAAAVITRARRAQD